MLNYQRVTCWLMNFPIQTTIFPVKSSQKLGSHRLAHPEHTQKRCAECAGCRLVVVHDESLDWYSGVCGWMDFFSQLLDGLSMFIPLLTHYLQGFIGMG